MPKRIYIREGAPLQGKKQTKSWWGINCVFILRSTPREKSFGVLKIVPAETKLRRRTRSFEDVYDLGKHNTRR
jgi:hypothetical protein